MPHPLGARARPVVLLVAALGCAPRAGGVPAVALDLDPARSELAGDIHIALSLCAAGNRAQARGVAAFFAKRI
jgi:hypothetical protein